MKVSPIAALLGFLLVLLPLKSAEPNSGPAFLNESISLPRGSESLIYLDQLQAIPSAIGKKVIYPPGLAEFVSKEKLNICSRDWHLGNDNKLKIRDYLNQCREVLGLGWKYDAVQDSVILDIAWHQPVSPSTDLRPLVHLLGTTTAASLMGHLFDPQRMQDPWETAMYTLLSQPQNFPHAWKVQLKDFSLGWSLGFANFWPGGTRSYLVMDAAGQEHLLVLHCRESFHVIREPPLSVVYYLFDATGEWEDGGVFDTSSLSSATDLKLDLGKTRITIEAKLQYETSSRLNVEFVGLMPSITSFGRFNWGVPTFAFDSSHAGATLTFTAHIKDTYLCRLTVEHGKLVEVLWKNGSILAPADYAAGFTPLLHLGN